MTSRSIRSPECYDTRKCFAANDIGGVRYCRILETTYKQDGECPFCKTDNAEYMNAKYHRMISDRGLQYRQVAAVMGVSPEYLSHVLSEPLSEGHAIRIKQAVRELTREKEKWTKNISK